MIRSLVFENLKGQTASHQFTGRNLISGQNEAGKTTIKDGISFVFAGTDSAGITAPTHLISRGTEGCRVEVTTDKASVSRTLTTKKNGTLKLLRDGMASTLTQGQIEKMVGPSDLFLAVFSPGYYFTLPVGKQQAILTELLPKVDRQKLLADLSGVILSAADQAKYDLSKRADLVALKVATDRRALERQVDSNTGAVRELSALPPVPEFDEAELSGVQNLLVSCQNSDDLWAEYRRKLESHAQAVDNSKLVQARNEQAKNRKVLLEKELAGLKLVDEPACISSDLDIKRLEAELQQSPPRPAQAVVAEADFCPTCGQAVGVSHRQKVVEENQRIRLEWEEENKKVEGHNAAVRDKLAAIRKKAQELSTSVSDARMKNASIKSQMASLKAQIASVREEQIPIQFPEPTPPQSPEANDEERASALRKRDELIATRERHNYVKEQRAFADEKIEKLKQYNASLSETTESLRKVEEALKVLPREELRLQEESLRVDGYSLSLEEKGIRLTRNDGTSYEGLSTGARMKADIALSLKLNSMMLRPINMIFVDNADLLDGLDVPAKVQLFIAKVVPNQKEVKILQL